MPYTGLILRGEKFQGFWRFYTILEILTTKILEFLSGEMVLTLKIYPRKVFTIQSTKISPLKINPLW